MKIIPPMGLSGLAQSHPAELLFSISNYAEPGAVGEGNVEVTIINGALSVNI